MNASAHEASGEFGPTTGRHAAVQTPWRWFPNPVFRAGAMFYAIGGAAVWEGVQYVAHHLRGVITRA